MSAKDRRSDDDLGLALGTERMVTLSLWRKAGWHGGGLGRLVRMCSWGLGPGLTLGCTGAGEQLAQLGATDCGGRRRGGWQTAGWVAGQRAGKSGPEPEPEPGAYLSGKGCSRGGQARRGCGQSEDSQPCLSG